MNQRLRIISAFLVLMLTLGMGAVASAEYVDINPEEHNAALTINQRQLYRNKTEDGVTFVEYGIEGILKKLFPGVYEGEKPDVQYSLVNINGKTYNFWEGVKNSVDNIVVVTNISEINDSNDKNDKTAHIRTVFAFPAFSEENSEVHLNFHLPAGTTIQKIDGLAEINGQDYKLYVYNYSEPLETGETSEPSLLEYVFDKNVTTEMIAQFGDEYRVLITSQAVQVNEFSAIANAFGVTFGEVTADNHPWK